MSEAAENKSDFIVVLQSAWVNEHGCGISYQWDGSRHITRSEAIADGFEIRGSDDFNIAEVRGHYMVWFGWMDERMDEDDDSMREIAKSIGLKFKPAQEQAK